MLAGLIFATEDADDRPDALAATLPFGGVTLIEFQARLLISAGASQILIAVARVRPELVGAVNRIGRRGVSVDIVRSAVEAADKVHPLARVLVLADGLMTTEAVVGLLAGEGADALLVTPADEAMPGFERVGADAVWAGIARIDVQRLADTAALPKEYDFQSTLLRVVAQAGAQQVPMPVGAIRAGHGIERDSRALADRGKVILAAGLANRTSWVDRYLIAPIARLALPQLVARAAPSAAVSAAGSVLALVGLGLLAKLWPGIGLGFSVASIACFAIGAVLCWLRSEETHARFQNGAIIGVAALAVLLFGRGTSLAQGSATGWTVALALIAAAALAERAATGQSRKRWWGSPAAYALLLWPFAIIGRPLAGLIAVALYALVTLAAAIEALRGKP